MYIYICARLNVELADLRFNNVIVLALALQAATQTLEQVYTQSYLVICNNWRDAINYAASHTD